MKRRKDLFIFVSLRFYESKKGFGRGGTYPLALLDTACFFLAYLNLRGKNCINFLTISHIFTSHIFTFSLKQTVFAIFELHINYSFKYRMTHGKAITSDITIPPEAGKAFRDLKGAFDEVIRYFSILIFNIFVRNF